MPDLTTAVTTEQIRTDAELFLMTVNDQENNT